MVKNKCSYDDESYYKCKNRKECKELVRCKRCGKEEKKCMLQDGYCEACMVENNADKAQQEFIESLIGQETDEGITITHANINELWKNGQL